MSTLMEKVRPVVFMKNEFQHREKLKLKCFFLEFLDYQGSDAREKNNDFLV